LLTTMAGLRLCESTVQRTTEDAGARLGQDLPDHREGRVQPLDEGLDPRARARRQTPDHGLGVPHHSARDSQEPLVEALHARARPLPQRRTRPAASRAAALRDLEDWDRHADGAAATA
jgi:hypothetical protein